MGTSGSKSDESGLFYSDTETADKFAAVVSTALERNSMDQNYSIYENLNIRNIQNQLTFHHICGRNIQFPTVVGSVKRVVAERNEKSFCDGIVFSSRPVVLYERLYVKILKRSSSWNGMIRFGFTSVDPDSLLKVYTDLNNNQFRFVDLPKYAYPDLTNKEGYWAASMPDINIKENDTIFFYVDSIGCVHYGLNKKYEGVFLSDVKVYNNERQQVQPLWAIIDIYGNTLAIELSNSIDQEAEFVGHSQENEMYRPAGISLNSIASSTSSTLSNSSGSSSSTGSSLVTVIPNNRQVTPPLSIRPIQQRSTHKVEQAQEKDDDKLDRLLVSFRRLCVDNHLNESLHEFSEKTSNQHQNKNPIKQIFSSIPILFHETTATSASPLENISNFLSDIYGQNLRICKTGLVAFRDVKSPGERLKPTTNAYAFLNQSLQNGRRAFCLQVVSIDQNQIEQKMSLSIGCTNCDPRTLSITDLPNDSDLLIDRPEYWIVYKNFYNSTSKQLSIADELCFRVDERTGNLSFSLNGNLETSCLFSVDPTQNLWFFFDLCGRVSGVRLIPCCSNQPSLQQASQINQQRQDIPVVVRCDATRRSPRPVSALIELYRSQLMCENSNENLVKSPKLDSITGQTNCKTEKRRSVVKEECRICWENPIECVLYSCGHMCLCWNCASNLKKQSSQTSSSSKPLCPICRIEIIDIIRFFKS